MRQSVLRFLLSYSIFCVFRNCLSAPRQYVSSCGYRVMWLGERSFRGRACSHTERAGCSGAAWDKPNPPRDVTGVKFQWGEGGGCGGLTFWTLTNERQVCSAPAFRKGKKKEEEKKVHVMLCIPSALRLHCGFSFDHLPGKRTWARTPLLKWNSCMYSVSRSICHVATTETKGVEKKCDLQMFPAFPGGLWQFNTCPVTWVFSTMKVFHK